MTVSRPLILPLLAALVACQPTYVFEPDQLASGPGAMVGNGAPLTPGDFPGGDDVLPAARQVPAPNEARPPDCDAGCVAYCAGAGLTNPVNRGLCRSLWGVGRRPGPSPSPRRAAGSSWTCWGACRMRPRPRPRARAGGAPR
ncbi:hypothetical protein ACN28S_03055 [Cystobacter fuscus]